MKHDCVYRPKNKANQAYVSKQVVTNVSKVGYLKFESSVSMDNSSYKLNNEMYVITNVLPQQPGSTNVSKTVSFKLSQVILYYWQLIHNHFKTQTLKI